MDHGHAERSHAAVTSHVAHYVHHWYVVAHPPAAVDALEVRAAQLLVAAGRGPARIPACEHALRHNRLTGGFRDAASRSVLQRALSLLCPGELRELRVADAKVVELVLTALRQVAPPAASIAGVVLPPHDALDSLRVVAWSNASGDVSAALTLVERCAPSLTELDCVVTLQQDLADRVLAGCTRLESLTHASYYTPAAWLGLAQLHTLRGVDLGVVSTAAIAAALPRLHTLEVFFRCPAFFASPDKEQAFSAAKYAANGFTKDLLPRLHVFQFNGSLWPQLADSADSDTVAPLPFLQELFWQSRRQPPRAFMGARPVRLHIQHSAVVEWLPADDVDAACSQVRGECPLTRVRELLITACDTLDASDAARLFRAAPQLRKFTAGGLTNCPQWVASTAGREDCDVAPGHPYLRHLTMKSNRPSAPVAPPAPPSDCAMLLRGRRFPQLRQLGIDDAKYCATAAE
jgi:hypothetical protein